MAIRAEYYVVAGLGVRLSGFSSQSLLISTLPILPCIDSNMKQLASAGCKLQEVGVLPSV